MIPALGPLGVFQPNKFARTVDEAKEVAAESVLLSLGIAVDSTYNVRRMCEYLTFLTTSVCCVVL